jgi:selenide,water dikinase
LYDPQTAGGLLISVAQSDAERMVSAMREQGVAAVRIGEVVASAKPAIEVF